MIHESSKTVVLPDTFKESDNFIGAYLFSIARKLDYTVRLLPYSGKTREIEAQQEKIQLGIYMSLSDGTNTFRFTKKIDGYEIGRTLSRAQQIVGALGSAGMDSSVLRENQVYFGNVRPPKGTKPKEKVIKEQYIVHTLPSLFKETDVADELSRILAVFLRRSWVLVDPMVLWKNLVPYITPYSEVVTQACSKEIVLEPPKGKREAVTKQKVPQKVRNNSLMLKEELEFLNLISSPIWQPTPWESLSQEDWASQIWIHGLDKIKKELSAQYNYRASFLSKLATVTTKRLRDLRKALNNDRLRKSDVKAQDLTNLILSRENPVKQLSQEILSMDPQGLLFLREYYLGGYIKWRDAGGESDLREYIQSQLPIDIISNDFYSDLAKLEEEKLAKLSSLRDSFMEKEATQKAMLSDLKKKFGATFVDKWTLNVQNFDPVEYLVSKGATVIPAQKKGVIPPHDQIKPRPGKREKLAAFVKDSPTTIRLDSGEWCLDLTESDLYEVYKKIVPSESAKSKQSWDKLTLIQQLGEIVEWSDDDDIKLLPDSLSFLEPISRMDSERERQAAVREFCRLQNVRLKG